MAVPTTLDTFWQCWAWIATMLLLEFLGQIFPLLRGWHVLKVMYLKENSFANMIGKWMWHIVWFLKHIQYAISGFWVYYHYHPLAPTVSGTWNEWWLNLTFIIVLPVVCFFHFLAVWYFWSVWAGFALLVILLLLEVNAFLLTWLIAPKLFLPGILFVISIVFTLIMLFWYYSIWGCMKSCDIENLRKVWFCSELELRPQEDLENMSDREFRPFGLERRVNINNRIGVSMNDSSQKKGYSQINVGNSFSESQQIKLGRLNSTGF